MRLLSDIGAGILLAVLILLAGLPSIDPGLVQAWSDSESAGSALVTYVSDTSTGSTTSWWKAPATGSLYVASSRVKIWGAATLGTPGDNVYNKWVSRDCEEKVEGTMEEYPHGFWQLVVGEDFTLSADASYVYNGGWLEDYRAEVAYTSEIRGDFGYFTEDMRVIDSYSSTGNSTYDAMGGGQYPINHADGGNLNVKAGPGPSSGVDSNTTRLLINVNQTFTGNSVDYWLYVRGKQYIHNNEEEAVALGTSITHTGASSKGWDGNLIAYDSHFQLFAIFPAGK